MTIDVDDFGNTGYGVVQHVVGSFKCFFHADVVAQNLFEFFVQNDDERVHLLFQLTQAFFGHAHTARAFVFKWFRHNRNGQNTQFFRHFRDHRRRTCARATAHTGGDKHHIRIAQHIGNAFAVFFRRRTTDFRFCARAQTGLAQLQFIQRRRVTQCLRIGIGDDEFHPLYAFGDHVLDGIAACATNANHFNDCSFWRFI